MQELKSSQYSFIAKNIFWLQASRILTRVFALLALPIITAFLAPDAFGIIALFTVEASFLSSFYDLGLNAFAGRMIYKYDRRNKKTCSQYMGVILFYIVIFSFIGMLVSMPLARVIKGLIFKDVFFPHAFLFYIPLIEAFFLSIYGFTEGNLLNLQENKKVFVCEMLSFWLLVPIKIIGLVWLGFTWVQIVILELIVWIIVTSTSLWLIRTRLGFSFKRLGIIKNALKYSLPYIAMNFSSWVQNAIDRVFLGRMHKVSYVGVYSIGMKISEGYELFSRPINISMKPEISKRLDMRDKDINKDIGDYFTLFFQFSLFLIFGISIFSREIVILLTDAKYADAFRVIPFAVLGAMFGQLSGLFRLKFIYKNKTIFFPVVIFLGAALNALFNYHLIPRFGILGAASATALADLAIVFVCYFISQRLHFTRYNMIKNFSVLIVVVSLIFPIQNLMPITITMIFLKSFILLLYAAILYRYFLRTNKRLRDLRDILAGFIRARFPSLRKKEGAAINEP